LSSNAALPPNLVALSGILLASVRGGLAFFGEAGPPHGRGGVRGAKVGNGVAVGAGVAVVAGIGVATCACAPAKKATKPSRTHHADESDPRPHSRTRGRMSELNGSLFHR